jgi:hypothetical protein
MPELVGRRTELAQVRAFVGGRRSEPSALVIEGVAGIGKTRLLAVALAEPGPTTVLRACCVEAESSISHAILADLLSGLDVDDALAPARRRALRVALAHDDVGDDLSIR